MQGGERAGATAAPRSPRPQSGQAGVCGGENGSIDGQATEDGDEVSQTEVKRQRPCSKERAAAKVQQPGRGWRPPGRHVTKWIGGRHLLEELVLREHGAAWSAQRRAERPRCCACRKPRRGFGSLRSRRGARGGAGCCPSQTRESWPAPQQPHRQEGAIHPSTQQLAAVYATAHAGPHLCARKAPQSTHLTQP